MNLKVVGMQALSGEITPSGSKNAIVALLPATLLFNQPVTFENVPDITDVTRLVNILTKLGSQVNWDKTKNTITVDNSQVSNSTLGKEDLGHMRGTSLLWGPALARFKKIAFDELPGGCTLGARPLDAHYQAFKDLGVTVDQTHSGVSLDATSAHPGTIWLLETSPTATENAIMLAVSLPGTTTIINAATEPNVQDLCNFLKLAGADISHIGSSTLTINGGRPLSAITHRVINDLYEIGTFLALGAATGGQITVHHALPEHFTAISREFSKFNISITFNGDSATVAANQKPSLCETKTATIIRSQPWPALPVDLLPVFIPLALAVPTGQVLFHNWMYEAGLFWTSELTKLGANVIMCDPHRIIVGGGNRLKGATLEAPYIIRAVISMCMAGMMAAGESLILNADTIHRGHPNFVANLKKLGAQIDQVQ